MDGIASADQDFAAGPSTLHRVFWLNLDRRRDRAEKQQQALEGAGLAPFAERISAVDGRSLNLHGIAEEILTLDGRYQALHPPAFVLGKVLTPGAVGLWLTWHGVLERILEEAQPEHCYLVVEDDADYVDNFGIEMFRILEALDALDPNWDACAVGFIRSKTRMMPLNWPEPRPADAEYYDELLCIPAKLCGASGILVHGPQGAAAMLQTLFPVGPDQQFDLKISETFYTAPGLLRMYISKAPLAAAPLSEAGDTDIQRIPAAARLELQREAAERHEQGDLTKPSRSSVPSAEERSRNQFLFPLLAAEANTSCAKKHWPTARRTLRSASLALLTEKVELLRSLDQGVPHLRKLSGEYNTTLRQLETCLGREAQELKSKLFELQQQLEEALEVRRQSLEVAPSWLPRSGPLPSAKTVLLCDGAPLRTRRGPFRKVLVMGLYHSCTNAVVLELEKRFRVEVINDWRVSKAGKDWKHRVNWRKPPGLSEDCLALLMVKEPHFWLQSCSRELRNFFEIRPFQELQGLREELPAETLEALFGPLEHDCIAYPNALALWNDTLHSYFCDWVYPPDQALVVRCEDFLFNFHKVMDLLEQSGLPPLGDRPEPHAGRAKGHSECRTRESALEFYARPRNRTAKFTAHQLSTIARDLDMEIMQRLHYNGDDPVRDWTKQL